MGKAVEAAAAAAGDLRIKARIERGDLIATGAAGPAPGGTVDAGSSGEGPIRGVPAAAAIENLELILSAGDVVVDFSSPEGCRQAAGASAACGAALVSGTTGLAPGDESALEMASRRVPVLRAANFSLGLLALRRALAAALEALPATWDIEIVERHHRRKVDSPSGTALLIAREAARRRGLADSALRFGREGAVGPRPAGEIGVHAVRGGTWVGDHAVLLAGDGEWVEVRHVVEDRASFALGALAAARFVAHAPPGLYNLEDVLGRPRRTR
jgi:4-hydroxy-tetrahydrodipicolinate reductase